MLLNVTDVFFKFAIGPNQFSTTFVCWVCGSVDRTPTRRGFYGVNMQHLSCVHLSVDFRRFMLKNRCVSSRASRQSAYFSVERTHRSQDTHSSSQSPRVGAQMYPRSTHDARQSAKDKC